MATPIMSGLEKVALLLKRLPPEVVDKVMRHLSPRHAGLVQSQMVKLEGQDDLQQRMAGVLDEAVQIIENGTRPRQDVPANDKAGAAKELVAKVAPPREQTQCVDIRVGGAPEVKPAAGVALMPLPVDANADPLRALAALPAELLAAALNNENARSTSLLMNALDIEVAGQIYKRLAPAKRREVSLRFTDQAVVGEELIKRIAQGVLKKCQALREASPTGVGAEEGAREKRIAALLRGLERTERTELITALEESDAELTGRIKALLYLFEDITRMENSSVQKLLSEVDVKSLAQALRGAEPEIEAKILANLSKRAQESLKEEVSLTGSVPAPKVRLARQTLVEAIQRLDQRGELVMIE